MRDGVVTCGVLVPASEAGNNVMEKNGDRHEGDEINFRKGKQAILVHLNITRTRLLLSCRRGEEKEGFYIRRGISIISFQTNNFISACLEYISSSRSAVRQPTSSIAFELCIRAIPLYAHTHTHTHMYVFIFCFFASLYTECAFALLS